MADSSVVIRVRLTDDGQVKTSLRAVGESGKAAADQIKAAMAGINFSHATQEANKLSAALSNMARPLSSIGVAFGTFAGNIASQITSKLAEIPHAFSEIIAHAVAANKEMKDFADQVGSSVGEISGVISGLANFGVALESVELLLKRLSVTVQEEWPKVAKEVRDASEQQRGDILKVAQAEIALEEATEKAATAQIEANLAVAKSTLNLAEIKKQQSRESTDFLLKQISGAHSIAQVEAQIADNEKQAHRQRQDAATQEINSINSIKGARISLFEAQVRLHELVTGEKLSPEEQRALEIEKARLQVAEARQRVRDLQRQRQREQEDASDRQAQAELQQEQNRIQLMTLRIQREREVEDQKSRAAQLELQRQEAALRLDHDRQAAARAQRKATIEEQAAQLNLDKARSEADERAANSITKLKKDVEDLGAGRDIGRQLSPDQLVRGLLASEAAAGKGAEALGELGDSVFAIGAKAPDLLPFLYKLSDTLKATGNRALATAVLVKLFGRSVSGDLVDAMMEGSEALKAEAAEMQRLGLATSEEDAAVGERYVRSRNRFFAHVQALKNKIGTEFARFPGFETWTRLLDENVETVTAWAAKIGRLMDSVSFALANVFTGKSFEQFAAEMKGKMSPEQLLQVEEWQQSITKIANAFRILYNGLKALFDLLTPIVTAAAAAGRAIGELFGVGEAGEGLAVILAIGLIIGGLRAIPGLVGLAIAALLRLFATGAAGGVAAGAAGGAAAGAAGGTAAGAAAGAAGGAAGGAAAGGGLAALLLGLLRVAGPAGILLGSTVPAGDTGATEAAKLLEGISQDKLKALNEQFQDKSSDEYKQRVAALRDELNQLSAAFRAADPKAADRIFGDIDRRLTGITPAAERAKPADGSEPVVTFTDAIKAATEQLNAFGAALAKMTSGGGGSDITFTEQASGGMISGPGTGTSDSIMARLSNGEFVMNARSVARYGVPFMNAVNSGSLPGFARGGRSRFNRFNLNTGGGSIDEFMVPLSTSIEDFMASYENLVALAEGWVTMSSDLAEGVGLFDPENWSWAKGGLVGSLTSSMASPSLVPRFAGGGLARGGSSAGRTLNLTIDGNRFSGLGVPDRVAGRLERYAIANQVSSLGRKPSWRK
jgi:hypothetical protein